MRRPAVLTLVAGGVLAALLIAGCTSSGGASGGTSDKLAHAGASASAVNSAGGDQLAAPPGPIPAAGVVNGVAGGAGGSGDTIGGDLSGVADSASSTETTLVADTRDVIRTAQMTVGVKVAADVAAQANKAEAVVTDLGGEVFDDSRNNGTNDTSTAITNATATLTLKVPPAQLTRALNDLSQLGREQSRSLSSQDVTTQVADVNARLSSAAASIARLRSLFSSASKVSDVIEIENELSTREAQLESLQAQQRALSSETVMATITLVLTTIKPPPVIKPVPHHHAQHYTGIAGAFANGWHHFVATGAWIARAFGTVVTFAVVIALLIAAGLWLYRRRPVPAPTPVPVVE